MQERGIRILLVDDDEDDFFITSQYIKHIQGADFIIDWCPQYAKALRHMVDKSHDIYFVDYRLGAKSGVDLLKEAIQNGCEEPIILLTGKGNYQVDIEAMETGAVDYLVKTDLTIEKLERCIRYALDRTSTLKALKRNERKYRNIFEKSKDIVFIGDADMGFQDVNEAVHTILGYTRFEVLDMSLYDLLEQPQHKMMLKQAFKDRKEINDWEITLQAKNGDIKSCIINATVDDTATHSNYIQGIIHDITNLKKIEKATLQAEKLAAAGRLVRTLAHEVRNPLNNITLSAEQMEHELKDQGSELYLNIIQRNCRRISDLISELLNTSRPSDIVLEEHVLQSVIDEVIFSAIDRLTLKRIKLHVSYPDEKQTILSDREKLKVALLNIIINAIEAMEEQKGNLSISIHPLKEHVVLNISDNGCGISEENISRLFEPYFTQKRNGMGLGLPFTLNILQSHRAVIEVNSQEGSGTTFTITFPISKDGVASGEDGNIF